MTAPFLNERAAHQCEVRLQNSLDDDFQALPRRVRSEAEQRRVDAGREHAGGVLDVLVSSLGDEIIVVDNGNRAAAQATTLTAIRDGVPVIADAWLPPDNAGGRIGRPDLLVFAGDGYLPVEIKLHLLTNEGPTSLETSLLASPYPASSTTVAGRRFRKRSKLLEDTLELAHFFRMLESHDAASRSTGFLGGVIDGSSTLWWVDIDLRNSADGRSVLETYDHRFTELHEIAAMTALRNADRDIPRPRDPWWHKDCESCPYESVCHAELAERDDVSLVRWSSEITLDALRSAGVSSRSELAQLDLGLVDLGERLRDTTLPLPDLIELARKAAPEEALSDVVGPRMGVRRHLAASGLVTVSELLNRDRATLELAGQLRDLGRSVRRARAGLAGGVLRQVDVDELDPASADVEVDIDMESYGHATYLWGALVSRRIPLEGVAEGYRAFVTFEPLDELAEAGLFRDFWSWFSDLRRVTRSAGYSFRAYCFWRSAEEGQMRRAVAAELDDLPRERELERFFASDEWVDLHQLVRDQLLTEGPLGLKALAGMAGFTWRDDDPSGEASMGWYEEAIGVGGEGARERLLAYNEDDVRATKALREWLGGAARYLPHVDDVDMFNERSR